MTFRGEGCKFRASIGSLFWSLIILIIMRHCDFSRMVGGWEGPNEGIRNKNGKRFLTLLY